MSENNSNSNLNSCACGYSYTVTDTWTNTYYIVPDMTNKAAPREPHSAPPCTCEGPPAYVHGGVQQILECQGPIDSIPMGGDVKSQNPSGGSKTDISGPTKTSSTKEPPTSECDGDCDCEIGTANLISDKTEQTGTQKISVTVDIENAYAKCSCPASSNPINAGVNYEWTEDCEPYTTTFTVEAAVYTRTRVQQYDVTCGCES